MNNTTQNDSMEYYQLLDEFIALCSDLSRRGFQYLVIILCHELYRFLYPVEPYADMKHTDPVCFMTNHLKKLINLAQCYSTGVVPYSGKIDDTETTQQMPLEKETSDLYSSLWKEFNESTLKDESYQLIHNRLSKKIIQDCILNKTVLDMGCGSGRFSLALARLGARHVVGVDVQNKSFAGAASVAKSLKLNVVFKEENVLKLSLADNSFDFVFCNGVLHHTNSIEQGLGELNRVLKFQGRAFLYLYAAGGFFWKTRQALRLLFSDIPVAYTQSVLRNLGMPSNRFIFCDTWYVPVEMHTTTGEVERMMDAAGFHYEKIVGQKSYDLDKAIMDGIKDARIMWGDGEHRYLLNKKSNQS